MDFPTLDLMDPTAYYQFLLDTLHPDGLRCPTCRRDDTLAVHDRHRPPVLDYRCRHCSAVFNAYTGTPLQKTPRTPAQLVLLLRGIWRGTPTAQLARELGCDRKHLLELRHKLQALAETAAANTGPVAGRATEADEMFQNAGEKGVPHLDPDDPPRRRANERRGHGTYANDRPPVAGVVSRASGQVVLRVVERTDQPTPTGFVSETTEDGAMVYTDEWGGYNQLPDTGRGHATVCHTPGERERARDDDGDGIREGHDNTLEGLWAALRTFLRPFRGVSKWRLGQYVAVFQWAYNLTTATTANLRRMLGLTPDAS